MFTSKTFAQECKRWKPLIQLNLIRSVLVILDNLVLDPSLSSLDVDTYLSLDPSMPMPMPMPNSPAYSRRPVEAPTQHLLGAKVRKLPAESDMSGDDLPTSPSSNPMPMPQLTRQHEYLKMRLSPLIRLQELLISRLAAEFGDATSYHTNAKLATTRSGEFFVRAKSLLGRGNTSNETTGPHSTDLENDNEITNVLDACRDDMITLWQDPVVRGILQLRDIHLEEGPGL